MVVVQRRPWHDHVTIEAAGVGAVAFIQNHDRVPHVVVQKVNPDFGAHQCPPPA